MAERFLPHLERLETVAASASGYIAIGGHRDINAATSATPITTSIQLANLPKLDHLATLSAGEHGVLALAFVGETGTGDTHEFLCAGDEQGNLLVWLLGDEPRPLATATNHHNGPIRALLGVGNRIVSVGDDGIVKISELSPSGLSPSELGATTERQLSQRALRAIAVSSDHQTLAVGGDDGIVRTFNISDSESPLREMDMSTGVGAIAFLGDGRIAAGCADGSVRLAFLEGAAEATDRARDAAHTAPVRQLIYTAALVDKAKRALPRRLLSISEDGDIKAWQVDTRRKPPTITVSKHGLTAAVLVKASARAKPERRGGTLFVTSRDRSLSFLTVDEEGKPSDAIERVRSRFAQLGEHLKSKKEAVRVEACSELTKLPEEFARIRLDRVLRKDKSATVRRAAAYAIGTSNRRRSRPTLREALNDNDKDVRASVLRALEKIEKDAPVASARAALASKHADMRIGALKRLPGLRDQSPLVPTLIASALSDSDEKVRAAALDALYKLEPDRPLRAARVALTRGPADVRRDVLIRIGRSRTALDRDGAELIERALDDDNEAVRAAAFLTSIAARSVLIAKVRAVDSHTKKAVNDIESGGTFADPAAPGASLDEQDLRPLYAAMACRFPDTALRAARLLALLGDSRATGALLQLSREDDSTIRRYVVEALLSAAIAMPADERILDRLRWLIDDPDETVRHAAFDALQLLAESAGARGELELAALALRAASSDSRVRALPLLVKFGGTGQYAAIQELTDRADELLGDALDDENDKVRGEAFRTLWAWHSNDPKAVLERGARCRQAEIRRRVIKEIPHQKPAENPWADQLLLSLVSDHAAVVGLDAYAAATKPKGDDQRVDVHLAAMNSASTTVRVRGLRGAPKSGADQLSERIAELVADPDPEVHVAAIEALDRLAPTHAQGFAIAFDSIHYTLRVRAMELCGRRQDQRCIAPAREFLAIPDTHLNRPTDELRQRAAAALADVGAHSLLSLYTDLTKDADPLVREMGSRGLATAAVPGDEAALVALLGHDDLPVRSWIAEGLARLGDERALPVLAGTLAHPHLPIRRGAIMGFAALGPDGVRGMLKGLDDTEHREIQDLVFAVIVARDLALTKAGEDPDLLLSALSAVHPEIRYAAARVLETRGKSGHAKLAEGLVGPPVPEKASDRKNWPDANERKRRLEVLVDALASDHPLHRYAATQVLALRPQPKAFWRESKALLGPSSKSRPRIPFTNWDREERQPRKRGWVRTLFRNESAQAGASASTETEKLLHAIGVLGGSASEQTATFTDASLAQLVFGTYAGLVRQAPVSGDADETHRVRRDAIARLAAISANAAVGREAVLPVLRRALSDPHHMVRRKAVSSVRSLYPDGALEPLALELSSLAEDVGRGAVDALIEQALNDSTQGASTHEDVLALAKDTINAPVSAVRRYALSRLPQLFESGSLEPWLLALDSRHADVRLNVVDRLVDSTDERVLVALARAMESDHEDLRLKAAEALATRGDIRTVDVLSGLLYSDDSQWSATEALVELAHARANPAAASAATVALIARLRDDPDQTADRSDLFEAIERIASPAAADYLTDTIFKICQSSADSKEDGPRDDPNELLGILAKCLTDREAPVVLDTNNQPMVTFVSAETALTVATRLVAVKDASIRQSSIERFLRVLPGRGADALLEGLLEDRVEPVRVAACAALAYRAANIEGVGVGALSQVLRDGRRELVLPAAEGLASRGSIEAFQPLLLVFKAGEQDERKRAIIAMGHLGDERVLEELEPLVESSGASGELEPEEAELLPAIIEAFGQMITSLEAKEKHEPAERLRLLVENMANEGTEPLRRSALIGLRRGGGERARLFIEAIAGDRLESRSIRKAAISQLAELGDAKSERVLAEIIRQGDYSAGSAALDALERIFPNERTRTELLALASREARLSAPAASFLSWFGDVDTLLDRLTSVTDHTIRSRLLRGLIRRGGCPETSLKALLASSDVADRADASWIVGAMVGSKRTTVGDSLRTQLEQALALAPSAHAKQAQLGASEESDRLIEAWVAGLWAAERMVERMVERMGAEATEAATQALGHHSLPSRLRVVAARYLATRANEQDLKVLESLLDDRDSLVRSVAAGGISRAAPAKAAQLIRDAVVSDGAALRPMVEAALEQNADLLSNQETRRLALSQMIDGRRVDALSAVATNGDKKTEAQRLAAIAALGRMGGADAESTLASLLDSLPDSAPEADAVRAASFRALRRLQRKAARLEMGGES